MPTTPDARLRLAALMEERRLELGLRWQDVAERGGVSLKALHSVRTADAEIRPLTRQRIEDGLQWEHGSLQRIEAGGDPLPVSAAAAPPSAAPEPPRETTDPGDDVTGAVAAALFGPKERKIWAHIRRRLEATPAGRALFSDPDESAAWPPESPDGFSGGAPLELTPEARQLLGATPAAALFTAPAEVIVWNITELPYRKRVGMIREYREPVRSPRTARRAGLRKPGALIA